MRLLRFAENSVSAFVYHEERRLQRKYAARTMIDRWAFVDNLLVGRLADNVPGAIVECGTWRGGMIAALAERAKSEPPREFVLFDSFEGLPPANDVDGDAARAWQADQTSDKYFANCHAEVEEAQETMRMASVDARIIKGWCC
jgi:O-methyltransferase